MPQSSNTRVAPTLCKKAIPAFGYADARKMLTWLEDAFGARRGTMIDGESGTVAHAEMWIGDACIMLGSLRTTGTPPTVSGQSSVYFVLSDTDAVDALFTRAVANGARVAKQLANTPYGSREFGVLDPEGNYWGFGTYAPA